MKLTDQQILEQKYFEQFAQHYPIPCGAIEYSDKPDILIHGDIKLGIEIAHLYKVDGKNTKCEQKQIIMRREVIAQAEQLYLSSGGRKIEISIDFDPQHPIMRNNITKIAKGLAVIAQEISSEHEGYSSYKAFELIPELRFIYHDGKEYRNSNWRHQQSFDVPTLSITRAKELVCRSRINLSPILATLAVSSNVRRSADEHCQNRPYPRRTCRVEPARTFGHHQPTRWSSGTRYPVGVSRLYAG